MVKAQPETFALSELLDQSAREAAVLAQSKGLSFTYVPSRLGTFSDAKLLKRVSAEFIGQCAALYPEWQNSAGGKTSGRGTYEFVFAIPVWALAKQINRKSLMSSSKAVRPTKKAGHRACDQPTDLQLIRPSNVSFSSVPGKGSCFSVQRTTYAESVNESHHN